MDQAKKIQEPEIEIQKLKSRIRIDKIEAVQGCQGYILKPVNLDNFLKEVGKYMVES